MAKVQLVLTHGGFQPETQRDEEQLSSIKIGDVIAGDFRKPRNPGFHRKAFKMLHTVHDNQDLFEGFDQLYAWMKIKAGLVDLIEMTEKGPVYALRSLSFSSMGDEEFDKSYNLLLTVAVEELGQEYLLEQFA